MSLQSFILPLIDAVRYSERLRQAVAAGWLLRSRASKNACHRAMGLSKALALTDCGPLQEKILQMLQECQGFDKRETWKSATRARPRFMRLLRENPALTRSIILKAPTTDGEKGVLLTTFEYNWIRLLLGLDQGELQWLDNHYHLVLSTSWSPTDYSVLLLAASSIQGPLFIQTNNHQDIPLIERLHPRLRCVQTLPCDWINPQFYEPKPHASRETDILMVANWGAFKRHWELFQALRRMPAELKIVLIGQREPGRSRESILALARSFGVPQQLEIHESLPISEVAAYQCNAKTSVILSRREGCCVAAVESLFAGCALGMRSGAHVGALKYVNEQTGLLLQPGQLHKDLMRLLEISGSLKPREWAMENISCEISSNKLNTQLKMETHRQNLCWSRDVAQHQWRPYPVHTHDSDRERLRTAYAELHQRFPRVFNASLIDTSWK